MSLCNKTYPHEDGKECKCDESRGFKVIDGVCKCGSTSPFRDITGNQCLSKCNSGAADLRDGELWCADTGCKNYYVSMTAGEISYKECVPKCNATYPHGSGQECKCDKKTFMVILDNVCQCDWNSKYRFKAAGQSACVDSCSTQLF